MSSAEQKKPEDERSKLRRLGTFLIPYLRPSLRLAIAFLMAVLLLRAGDAAWNLIKNAQLITGERTSTIIQMDLLQFLGFLLAWSLGLITVATWITNWVVREYSSRLKSTHEIARLREEVDKDVHEHDELSNKLNEISTELSRVDEQHKPMREAIQELTEENYRLKDQNNKLKRFLTEESRKLLY